MQSKTEIYLCAVHENTAQMQITNSRNGFLLKKQARLSSIHKYAFLDVKCFRYFYHVIYVENHQNQVYLFTGHPVCY